MFHLKRLKKRSIFKYRIQATTEITNFSGQHSSSTDRQAESEVRDQTLTISGGGEGRIICLDQSTQ